jgi:hypothetical protein
VPTPRNWVETGARFGHFTKGVLYALIGALALKVALGHGGNVAGEHEAVQVVGRQPFGVALLIAIAVGLSGFAIWRLIEGIRDTSHRGSDGKGLAQRGGAVVSGLVNAALAIAVLQLGIGSGREGGARSWVGAVLEQPFGAVLLGLVGGGVIVAGLAQFYQAYTKRFLDDFRWGSMTPVERRWVTRAGQVGYAARGVVFPIVGYGLLRAALQHDATETRDTRRALLEIASSGNGPLWLALVAVGLFAFGLFMVASARYRTIPT